MRAARGGRASPRPARRARLPRPPASRFAPADELLLVCNWAPRRPFVLHPPEDPLYLNLLLRSADEGRTWSAPVVAPAYGWNGVECAGLTDLGQGNVLLNQWRFDWLTLPAARARGGPDRYHLSRAARWPRISARASMMRAGLDAAGAERLMPWARGPGPGLGPSFRGWRPDLVHRAPSWTRPVRRRLRHARRRRPARRHGRAAACATFPTIARVFVLRSRGRRRDLVGRDARGGPARPLVRGAGAAAAAIGPHPAAAAREPKQELVADLVRRWWPLLGGAAPSGHRRLPRRISAACPTGGSFAPTASAACPTPSVRRFPTMTARHGPSRSLSS